MATAVKPVGKRPSLCEICLTDIAAVTCTQCSRRVCYADSLTFGDPGNPATWYRVCVVCVGDDYDTDELEDEEFS